MLDYKIHNQDEGQDYLVLIHGLGGNSKIFYKQLKQYKQEFNVITIELPGHGNSPDINNYFGEFTSKIAAREVLKTLDYLNIQKAHFVGVSLGTIIIHDILQIEPYRVISTVLAGTVTRFSTFSKILLFFGNLVKNFTPYMWIYSLFARIMMPKSNHKESRLTFVKEAVKMKRKNFLGWYELCYTVEESYRNVQEKAYMVPKLYVSGSEDHLFINPLKKDIEQDPNATLHIIEHCGHVCNIEKPKEFNKISLEFLLQSKEALKQAT
ncbi:alpha/beta fold hydrolase [Piscibacillus sp. B03]|uniref:alpha/beta fold hydrolase n=1 Tax=Piscibacillus sp. B03 TaxID=3457430 RepID=UPI003FCD0080